MAREQATTQILTTSATARTLFALAEEHSIEMSEMLHDLVLWLDLTTEGQDAFALFAQMDDLRTASAVPPKSD